jgi:hypothetical protein
MDPLYPQRSLGRNGSGMTARAMTSYRPAVPGRTLAAAVRSLGLFSPVQALRSIEKQSDP